MKTLTRGSLLVVFVLWSALSFGAPSANPNRITKHNHKEALTLRNWIMYSTVRIISLKKTAKGLVPQSGTGFYYNFKIDSSNIPVIVTNVHVIKDCPEGAFYLRAKQADGTPSLSESIPFHFSRFESLWIKHPDPKVDLCIMPIAPILNQALEKGERFFYATCTKALIPTHSEWNETTALEDIIMVGYPIGVWDAKHNLPVVRRGITATPPGIDYNGKSVFLADIAAFPGSSGSPIFLYTPFWHPEKNGQFSLGRGQFELLGVLSGVFEYTSEGKIIARDVPSRFEPRSETRIPINLGVVIKANKLLDFKTILKKMLSKH